MPQIMPFMEQNKGGNNYEFSKWGGAEASKFLGKLRN